MASMQCQVQQTTMVCQKTTSETCHSKANHGESFTDKVKEMAHSTTKMFEHKNHQESNGQHCDQTYSSANHESHAKNQSSACHSPGTTRTTERKDGHEGNFLANIGECIKNMTSKKKKNRAGKCNDSRSDSSSSSSDESDNEFCEKKN